MGTVYMILSVGLFVLETVFHIYIVSDNSKNSEALFISLLALVMGPLILVNFVSAMQVTRTQDFTGKRLGRVICIVFHSFQLGMIWRSLKLLILYDERDWVEYLSLRIVHCGFQSLPFFVLLTYSMFLLNAVTVVQVVTLILSLLSGALALSTYGLGVKLYQGLEFENTAAKVRRSVGILLLIGSCFLILLSRCASIALFAIAQPYWVALPLGVHFIVYFAASMIRLQWKHQMTFLNFIKKLYISFISVFDLVHKGFKGVKCKFVLFYTAILVENIIMSATWVLSAKDGYQFKLLTVVVVLVSFIFGMILKYASCGCVYEDAPDLLNDAFNSPALSRKMDKTKDQHMTISTIEVNGTSPLSSPNLQARGPSPVAITDGLGVEQDERPPSKKGSSSSSGRTPRPYDNHAFNWEPANDSKSSSHSPSPKVSSAGSEGLGQRTPLPSNKTKERRETPSRRPKSNFRYDGSNADLASFNSRNTNTLNVSAQSMYNNGFEDPFRERRMFASHINPSVIVHPSHSNHKHMARGPTLKEISINGGLKSLDSSDLYPSVSSDSSSMTSYTYTKDRYERKRSKRILPRPRYDYDSRDGYSTDVSNSEYLSFNDYSVDDSSDWSETSESDCALTWPPSHSSNLLGMSSLPEDKVASKDSVMHWLDTIDAGDSVISDQYSTHELSCAEDTDTGTTMQRFEIPQKQQRRGKFKRLLPKQTGALLKFCSLNYKTRHKNAPDRPYPLSSSHLQPKPSHPSDTAASGHNQSQAPIVELQPNFIQESIV